MRGLALVPALALVLSGCAGGDPESELRGDVAAVIAAANDRDAQAVRDDVAELLSTLRAQVGRQEIGVAEAERIRTLALRIAESAVLLEPEPTPSPSPSPTEEPSPTPSPTEEPSPTPEPTEEPTPTPEPTEEPEPEESVVVEVPPVKESPSPSQVTQPVSEPSPGSEPDASPQPTS